MSITAHIVQGKSVVGDDYGYVTILVSWKGHPIQKPTINDKTQVMWAHESVYGVVGSKVGDFVGCFGENSFNQEGVFTHRTIAERLISAFSGLKINELEWIENPLEKTLRNGKPRANRAKWFPANPVDLVHVYSDVYIDVRNPAPISTDFFTVTRWNETKRGGYEDTWFCCSSSSANTLTEMNYQNLDIRETTVTG